MNINYLSQYKKHYNYIKSIFGIRELLIILIYILVMICLYMRFSVLEVFHNIYFLPFFIPIWCLYLSFKLYKSLFNDISLIRYENKDIFKVFIFYNQIVVFISMLLDFVVFLVVSHPIIDIEYIVCLVVVFFFYSEYVLLFIGIETLLYRYTNKFSLSAIITGIIIGIIQALQLDVFYFLTYQLTNILSYVYYALILYIIRNIIYQINNSYQKLNQVISIKKIMFFIGYIAVMYTLSYTNRYVLAFQSPHTTYGFVLEDEDIVMKVLGFIKWFIPLEIIIILTVFRFINHYRNNSIYFFIRNTDRRKWLKMEYKKLAILLLALCIPFMTSNYIISNHSLVLHDRIIDFLFIYFYLFMFVEIYILLYVILKNKFYINVVLVVHFFLLYIAFLFDYNNVLFLNQISMIFLCFIICCCIGFYFMILHIMNNSYYE